LPAAQQREVARIATASLKEYDTPGMSVAIVRGGRVAYAGGYGIADRRRRLRATAGTRYEIASLTKLFTAVLVIQLVEQNRLGLDEPLAHILGRPGRDGAVRVRQLLAQTSGIPDFNSARAILSEAAGLIPGRVDRSVILATVENLPPAFAAGSRFEYSNSNYLLLGAVLEAERARLGIT